MARRNRFGLFEGSFDGSGREGPTTINEQIVPFLSPCGKCERLTLHQVGEQGHGITVGLPFFAPIWTSHTGFHAICSRCATIRGQLTEEQLKLLRSGVIPHDICYSTRKLYDPPPYTKAFTDSLLAKMVPPEYIPAEREYWEKIMIYYTREDGLA